MRVIRTIKTVLAAMVIILLLASCGRGKKPETPYTADQIATVIIASQADVAQLSPLFPEDDYFAYYLSEIYGIGPDMIKDGAIYYSEGMAADETAVFLLSDAADSDEAEEALLRYKETRASAFAGYAPLQAAKLENGVAVIHGDYAALIICDDINNARAAFLACFGDDPPKLPAGPATVTPENTERPGPGFDITEYSEAGQIEREPPQQPEEPPEKLPEEDPIEAEDPYDHAAISEAWDSGDYSGLSPKNREIIEACSKIIAALITDGMSEYEKELAIHDWIIDWANYDEEAVSNSPHASPDPDNDNPYGLIFRKKAVCSGYTSTFQLFMDMLGIECITVEGTANGGEEHAWNMVRINGEWYCTDVTWDDPVGRQTNAAKKRYFNVPAWFMRESGHVWDENTTPAANAGKLYDN